MKRARRAALVHFAGLGLVLAVLLGLRVDSENASASGGARDQAAAAEKTIRSWREGPRATARRMILEYGPPERASWRALRWSGNAPWAKTIVHRSGWPQVLGPRKGDWLEQTVSYLVPLESVDRLQSFDQRLEINRRDRQMSARSPNEATNILLLNLAHEIALGHRDVDSAKVLAAKTEKLALEGKTSRYTETLLFLPRAKRRYAPEMVPARRGVYTQPKEGGTRE